MPKGDRLGSVGMPAHLYLEQFGSMVWDVFGEPPFLVGTALTAKEWRDVDVRLILRDEDFDALLPDYSSRLPRADGKWCALCMAFSALGKQMTGLPIDFQIQRMSEANEKYSGPRESLGLISWRIMKPEK